ncbi:MAG: hypothetical protein H0U75_02140 [Legionella sp.]|nr:hypothetical protein [Legionella sp.]
MSFKEKAMKYGMIYKRKVMGYVRTMGKIVTGNYPGPFASKAALLFLMVVFSPISLLIIGPIKSLADLYFRRHEIPKTDIDEVVSKIEAIKETAAMKPLLEIISDYNAKSYSSTHLKSSLLSVNAGVHEKIYECYLQTEKELKEDQFTDWDMCNTKNVEDKISAVELNSVNRVKLDTVQNKRVDAWAKVEMNDQKCLIENFLLDPINRGKQMPKRICSYFFNLRTLEDALQDKQNKEESSFATANALD